MPFDFDRMVDEIADAIAERALEKISERIHGTVQGATASTRTLTVSNGNGRRTSKLRGIKRDMSCRYPNCKNRSKGPRFAFFCDEHFKLPKAQKALALSKWKAAHEKQG